MINAKVDVVWVGLLIIYSNLSTSLKVSNVEVVVVVRHNFILKTYSNSGDSLDCCI